MNLLWPKTKAAVKGIFPDPIPFKPLLPSGDSSPYFGNYEGQKYGTWDTDLCWDFSFTELIETRLEMLEKMGLIPADTLAWCNANGYKDSDGDWYLSRRWEGILSGVQDNGNSSLNAAYLSAQMGLIPNSMLPYNQAEAYTDATRTQFIADYFNPSVITPAMKAMGLEFLKRFKIQAENEPVSITNIMTYLTEGSMTIGVPAQAPGWNQIHVAPTTRQVADHAVELYAFVPTDPNPYKIYDSYEPHLKDLPKDYPIMILTRISLQPLAVASPVLLPQFSSWMMFWMNVKAWISGQSLPFPSVPIGGLKPVATAS